MIINANTSPKATEVKKQKQKKTSAGLVMGEDLIRGKLGNSRIGVAIMADIRPLNHQPLLASY